VATSASGQIDLYLKTYETAQGDGFLRDNNVIFYHPLDDFEEVTQDQVWQGSSAFVAGKIGNAGTSAAAVASFGFTTEEVGFTQTTLAEPVFCVLGGEVVVFQDYTARTGKISGTSVSWGSAGSAIADVDHPGIIPLTWNSGAQSGYVWSFGSSDGTKEVVHLCKTDGNAKTTTKVKTHNYVVGSGSVYTDARFAVMDMSGTIKPTGHILMGMQNQACIITVSGDTFSSGVTQLVSSGTVLHDLISIDDTRAVGLSADSKVRIWTINYGTDTITEGSGFTCCGTIKTNHPNNSSWQSRLIQTSGNKFAVINIKSSDEIMARLCQISGSTITSGTTVQVSLGHSPTQPDWESTFIRPSLLDNETIYIDYMHYESIGSVNRAKYRIANVNDMDLSLTNEYVRRIPTDTTNAGFIPAMAISPSSILALQRHRTTAPPWTKYWAFGEPQYGFNLTAQDETAYPNTSGTEHIAWAMWTKNLTTDDTVFTTERDYELNITPSSISLGSGTAEWNASGVSGLLATNNDGSNHLLVLDFEYSGSNDWFLRTSLDGSGWVNQSIQNLGNLTPVADTSDPATSVSYATHDEWVDELIMWGGTFERFTDEELGNLYELGESGYTMGQYQDIYQEVGVEVTGSGDLFIKSRDTFRGSGDLFVAGPLQIFASGDLVLEGYGEIQASGNLFLGGYIDTRTSLRIINRLTRTWDYHPQLIGSFGEGVSIVNIRVWNVVDGINTQLTVANSGCYKIGTTDRWGWSTEYLPFMSGYHNYHYYFEMAADTNETECGEFLLTVPERSRWIYP
jgi:hypothetical protein